MLAASDDLPLPLFAPDRATLYVPAWLAESALRILFRVNASFPDARPASLTWLPLDAVARTPSSAFATLKQRVWQRPRAWWRAR